jgi:hypothetical protein
MSFGVGRCGPDGRWFEAIWNAASRPWGLVSIGRSLSMADAGRQSLRVPTTTNLSSGELAPNHFAP